MLDNNEYVLDNILDKVVPNVHVMLPNIYVGLYICWVTTADICWVYMLDTQGICVGFIKYMLGNNFMYMLGIYVGYVEYICWTTTNMCWTTS